MPDPADLDDRIQVPVTGPTPAGHGPRHAREADEEPWTGQDVDFPYAAERDLDLAYARGRELAYPDFDYYRTRPANAVPEDGREYGGGADARLGVLAASAPSAIALLGGVWLVVSRLVFDYPAAGSTADGVFNGLIVGIAIALVALTRLGSASANPVLGLVTTVLGGWMIAAPWVFHYAHWGANSRPALSDVITGALVALSGLATWLASSARPVMAARLDRDPF